MRQVWYVVPALLFTSCTATPASEHQAEPSGPTGHKVEVGSLFGSWMGVRDSGRTVVHEHWSRGADGTPSGMGVVVSGKDTIHIENLALLTIKDTLYYAVSIGRGGGPATLFRKVHDRDSLVFANPWHDMPQRIVYLPQGPDAWLVTVSGIQHDQEIVDRYHFRRVAHTPSAP